MNRSDVLLFITAFAFVANVQSQEPDRPNIIVILADDLGYGDVGFNGCPDIPTPNIDSLATNGVRFPSGYATHPLCSPSRAGLITGRYQQRFGYEAQPTVDSSNPRLGVPTQELMLSEILKPTGYVCGAVGKWHLGNALSLHPLSRGFDEFFGFIGASSGYYNANVLRGETSLKETSYLTDAFTREGVAFINGHAGAPFFLYLAYNAVHAPYTEPPAVYMDRVANITDPGRRKYAAMLVAMDDGVGQVLETLRTHNILNRTLIFFLSDNGAPNHSFTRNDPLRGYKFDVLEGGVRVPFAIQWPERLPAGVIFEDPVTALDIVATVAAAAGVALPSDRKYDGVDLSPYLVGEEVMPSRPLFWRWSSLGADGPAGSLESIWAVRNGVLKLVTERAADTLPAALYDLSRDIGENDDLAIAEPAEVDSLRQLYSYWNSETISPLWQTNTDFKTWPLILAGDWNDFNKDVSTSPWVLTRTTAPALGEGTPDGFNWFRSTLHVAATGGDAIPGVHSFTVIGARSYSNQWGGVTFEADSAKEMPHFSGSALGPKNTITFEDGLYYSFRILDPLQPAGTSLKLAVLKTSAPPVSVSRSGQVPENPLPNDSILISITTNKSKAAEERIYLRWSTDGFVTSHMVEAVGSGVAYSATIPPQPAGAWLQYSVITSTVDLASYSAPGAIDPLILSSSDTFKVTPSPTASPSPTETPPPTATPTPTPTPSPTPTASPAPTPVLPSITKQPVNKTVTVGETAKFGVVATGTAPLGYQWKKNGLEIAGATGSSYTIPPATLADNGAKFSVVVANSAGSVTSNSKTLTVNAAAVPPSITVQPAGKTVAVGKTAKFTVNATGTSPLAYQWMKNGSPIGGATKKAYTTPPATQADDGSLFAVTVSNSLGTVTSNDAILTIK